MTSTLAALPFRQPAVIEAVGGDRAFRRRLLELGFLPGVKVEVLGVAPMGDPMELLVRGCRFSLRRGEAQAIAVQPTLPAHPTGAAQPPNAAKHLGAQ